MDKTLIVITGPTAVGKTQLCLDIARHFDIPVINADSRQIYKELSIGTAKPTDAEMQGIKHYFVGTLSLHDYYSASLFEQQVLEVLEDLFKTSNYALMSGGSMMYIDAVCDGIDDIPTIDDITRETMKRRLEEEGLEKLCEELDKFPDLCTNLLQFVNSDMRGKPAIETAKEAIVWIGMKKIQEWLMLMLYARLGTLFEHDFKSTQINARLSDE